MGIPWKLMFSEETGTLVEARRYERALKKLKSRLILERMVKGGIGIRIPMQHRDGSNPVEVRVLS